MLCCLFLLKELVLGYLKMEWVGLILLIIELLDLILCLKDFGIKNKLLNLLIYFSLI